MKKFQYSVLRYRRSKSSGELVNIGLMMVIPDEGSIFHFVTTKYARLSRFFGDFDGDGYRKMVNELERHFEDVMLSDGEPRQIHFGEYVATHDLEKPSLSKLQPVLVSGPESCFQWSSIMSGIHPRPEQRFQELKREFITRHEESRDGRQRSDESVIQRTVREALKGIPFEDRIVYDKQITGRHHATHTFALSWVNGITHVLDPISFDYLSNGEIEKKANQWCGTLYNLQDGEDFLFTGVTAPPPKKSLYKAYDQALQLIDEMPQTKALIEMDKAELVREAIERDLAT